MKTQNHRIEKKKSEIRRSSLLLNQLIDSTRLELGSDNADLPDTEISEIPSAMPSETNRSDRKEYSADHSNGTTEFVRYEVPGDGDCGFHSLGIKRKDVIKTIKESLDQKVIRRMYSGPIFADVASGEFKGNEPGIEDPEKWIPSKALVRRYLNKKVAKEWLNVGTSEELHKQTKPMIDEMPKVREPGGTLEAIALVSKMNIRIWTLDATGKLRLSAIFTYGSLVDGSSYISSI